MRLGRNTAGRAALVAAVAALVLPVAAGCGSSGASGSGSSSDGGTPVKGGTLTFAEVTPIQSTSPYPYTGDVIPWRRQVFNTLVGWQDGKATPQLATSWDSSSDGKQLTLHLRTDVKFSNGEAFTADDAKWSIDYAKNPANKSQDGPQLKGATVTAPDPATVRLDFDQPTPQALSVLSDVEIIWPKSDVQKNVIGTGPFMVGQLQPGVQMDLVRNPNYWEKDKPYLDKVVLKVMPDANAMVVALQSGSADLIYTPPLNKVASLKSGGYQVTINPGPGNYDFMMNTSKPPFDNEKLRQAMSAALDRARFSKIATSGVAAPICQIFPPRSGAYSKSLDDCKFDLNKAKQLVKESGVPTPMDVSLTIPQLDPALTTFAPIYQSDLKQIGINASITQVSQAEWLSHATNGDYPGMMGHIYSFGSLDPAVLMTAHPFGPEHNAENYSSPQYTTLVQKAEATPPGDQRNKAFQQVAQYVQNAAFILPVANNPGVFVASSKLHGLTVNVLSMPELGHAWLSH